MRFDEALNGYFDQLDINAQELARASGLSPAVISRYRRGERAPSPDGEALRALAGGLAALAEKRGQIQLTREQALNALRETLGNADSGAGLAYNFNMLATVLQIRMTELARALNFDPSYLSRIRAGQRQPADASAFANGVGRFVARRYTSAAARSDVARLLDMEEESLQDDYTCASALASWLLNGEMGRPDSMLSFLEKLDAFDLNDYIQVIRFDEMKVPAAPFQLPGAKSYYGLEGFRQALLDFLKATVLSRSTQPVFMCSDIPIEDIAQDMDFSKKWMYGIALILKKGLRLNMVHDLNRPFNEMMLGLEAWIPLYMTGQITPWYLKGAKDGVYGHLTFSSGGAALEGECVAGMIAHGRCHFSKARRDLDYCRQRSDALLKKAMPLMDIYREQSQVAYHAFLMADARETGRRRSILTAPPLHTLTDECLRRILDKNGVPQESRAKIIDACAHSRALAEAMLEHGEYEESFPVLPRAAFEAAPVAMALQESVYPGGVYYDYDGYLEHIRLTRAHAQKYGAYTISETSGSALNNIQILIREGKWAAVSKSKAPAIHFIIRHPRLCAAIGDMILPVVEYGPKVE